MNKKFIISLVVIFIFFSACSPTPTDSIPTISTVIHTLIVTVEVTVIVEKPVTVTFTPTPEFTATITPTPSITPTHTITFTPTNTPDLSKTATFEAYGDLTKPKRNGFFTVGVDILPGKWESTGSSDGCYWARLDSNQDTLDNHFGYSGGTVNILPSDYEVEFDDCGQWIYVEGSDRPLENTSESNKTDGFYTIGVEISPGRWKSTGSQDNCYWARLDQYQNTLDNHFGNAGGTVTIRSSDYEVTFEDCGIWEYLGP